MINITKTNKQTKSQHQLNICFLLFFSKVLNGIEERADYFGQTVQQTERKGSSLHLYLYNFDELLRKKTRSITNHKEDTHPRSCARAHTHVHRDVYKCVNTGIHMHKYILIYKNNYVLIHRCVKKPRDRYSLQGQQGFQNILFWQQGFCCLQKPNLCLQVKNT